MSYCQGCADRDAEVARLTEELATIRRQNERTVDFLCDWEGGPKRCREQVARLEAELAGLRRERDALLGLLRTTL